MLQQGGASPPRRFAFICLPFVLGVLAVGGAGGGTGEVAAITFLESSVALGVAEAGIDTWGVAVSDWDRDGCDDVYVGRHNKDDPHLYRNGCPGAFTDEWDRIPPPPDPEFKKDRHAVAFGDYDGDNRQDLHVTAGGGGEQGLGPGDDDQLYHQLPDGTFEDVADDEGIQNRQGSGRFAIWLDYELDGDLDLFVGHQVRRRHAELNRNSLWGNTGGHFSSVGGPAGIDAIETSSSGIASDLDLDGDLDVLTVPARSGSLYSNDGDGTFTWSSLGIAKLTSAATADYDNDGDLDLFLSRVGKLRSQLLRNDGGVWVDVTQSAGAGFSHGGAALWIDVDNDGWLDLFLARIAGASAKKPNVLLRNRGDGTFEDIAASAGVTGPRDSLPPRTGAAWGDFDRDGRVDLVVMTGFSAESVHVYLNRTPATNHWITVHLRDPGHANHEAIGSRVRVSAGGRTQLREVMGTTAEYSQSPPYLIVGVGAAAVVDTLRVRWPDGTSSVLRNLAVDRHYLVTKGA